ncbi:hypothetical protein T439DRAFT_359029 [Meredithblackwellia eburnea MCA 4105]
MLRSLRASKPFDTNQQKGRLGPSKLRASASVPPSSSTTVSNAPSSSGVEAGASARGSESDSEDSGTASDGTPEPASTSSAARVEVDSEEQEDSFLAPTSFYGNKSTGANVPTVQIDAPPTSSGKKRRNSRSTSLSEQSDDEDMDVDGEASGSFTVVAKQDAPASSSMSVPSNPLKRRGPGRPPRLPSEAPSGASSDSSMPRTRAGRRKPVGRPPGATQGNHGKRIPPAAAAKKAAAAAAEKKKKKFVPALIKSSFEVLVFDDPLIRLHVSHLTSPFDPPKILRPVSIFRSSTSTATFTSYLYPLPASQGVVKVRISSEAIKVPEKMETGIGPDKFALVVKQGGTKWIGVA